MEFYIPKKENLIALRKGECLNDDQIKDILRYIISNCYLSEGYFEEFQYFTLELLRMEGDIAATDKRQRIASKRLVEDMREGRGVSPLEVIWLSDTLYVDSQDIDRKRIITKKYEGDKMSFDVISAKHDIGVEDKVLELKRTVGDINPSKYVAHEEQL